MATFSYRYIKTSTGRPNRGSAMAYDEAELRERLAADRLVKELLEVEREPDPPATEPQLAYLQSLQVRWPEGVTLREASDLIENAKRQRSPGNDLDRRIAAHFRVETTRFTCKASIYWRIVRELEGSPEGLARFYAYRVYRSSLGEARSGKIEDPGHAVFRTIAADVLADPKVERSLKRAAASASCGFRWFGERRGSDGMILVGESDRTEVYKFVSDALARRGLNGPTARAKPAPEAREEWQRRRSRADEATTTASDPVPQLAPQASKFRSYGWVWALLGIGVLGYLIW